MPVYTKPTGSNSVMEIRDNGIDTVEFWLTSPIDKEIPQLPWAYSLDGVLEPWRPVRYRLGVGSQMLGLISLTQTKTVTFLLGDSGTTEVGGPTELTQQISRTSQNGGVLVSVGGEKRPTEQYVKVDGVWRRVESWVKHQGTWKLIT